MLQSGWALQGDKTVLMMTKGTANVKFDIVIPTPKGAIYCIYFKRASEVTGVAAVSARKVSVMKAHRIFGHPDEDKTRAMAKALGIELVPGGMEPCDACAAGKAKQKMFPRKVLMCPVIRMLAEFFWT